MPEVTTSLLQTLSDDLAGAVERIGPAIVRVEARRSNPASGLIWSSDGLIVTAHHVIEQEEKITVGIGDGRSLPATLVGRDPGSDLAVLRLQASGLPTVPLAPAGAGRVGQIVLAIGRPHALAATLGIVSAVGGPWRTWRGGQIERLIQTDAPFHPGFSGGALINAGGEVLGLASSQLGRGLNLALPTDLASGIAQTLASHGRVRRGYLGIGSQPATLPDNLRQRHQLSQTIGLLVVVVEPGGPAEKAGIMVGDIIIALAGATIQNLDELQARLASLTVGAVTTMRLIRGGEPVEIELTVGERSHS